MNDIINNSTFIQYKLKSRNIKNKIKKNESSDNCSNILKHNISINLNNFGNLTQIKFNLKKNKNEKKINNILIKNNI